MFPRESAADEDEESGSGQTVYVTRFAKRYLFRTFQNSSKERLKISKNNKPPFLLHIWVRISLGYYTAKL